MTDTVGVKGGSSVWTLGVIARPGYLLAGALAIGFAGEALLHGQPPGLGYALAALVAAAVWVVVGYGLGIRPSAAGLALLALILFYSAMVAVRASPSLLALNVLAGVGLALLMGAVYIPGGLSRLSLTDQALALLVSGVGLVVQPFVLVFGDLPRVARRQPTKERRWAPVALGALLALPLLVVFGALFSAADAVFAGYLRQAFAWLTDFPDLMARLVLSLMLAWLALGLARRAFTAEAGALSSESLMNLDFVRLRAPTAITALALLNVLFVGFVAVQAVYLFGGADTLARSSLTHSEYARSGFFELVTVATLVLGLILLMDWLTRFAGRRAGRTIGLLHGLLILLTFVVLASALLRMRLYEQEYGLTELRFYTTAFMFWLAVVLVLLAVTVLWERPRSSLGRRRFAFGVLLASLALVAALDLANPDAWIARVNLARTVAGIGQPLDAAYLTGGLSADAVPANLIGLTQVRDAKTRTELACGLRTRAQLLEAEAERLSWRGANLGLSEARRALAGAPRDLAAVTCPR